jgi:hypothetical protein
MVESNGCPPCSFRFAESRRQTSSRGVELIVSNLMKDTSSRLFFLSRENPRPGRIECLSTLYLSCLRISTWIKRSRDVELIAPNLMKGTSSRLFFLSRENPRPG